MTDNRHVCVVGQFLVDVTLPSYGQPFKLRAGGVMHAARALWAIGCPYSLCYCSPDYLVSQIDKNGREYSALDTVRFGRISGCPNVVLVNEPKEAGQQGYEYLLRDEQECANDVKLLEQHLTGNSISDVLLFPGGFDLQSVLEVLNKWDGRVFADANFEPNSIDEFETLGRQFESLIYSTSSAIFATLFSGEFGRIRTELLGKYAKSLLLKENRGGSRFTNCDETICTPAQQRLIQHSIGVGDCFDAVYIALRQTHSDRAALAYASCIAAEYASTTFPDDFRTNAQAWLALDSDEIESISGILLPWETRSGINVYIAAPDFDHVDTRPIELVTDCLRYHNFSPRLPVREHGQVGDNASRERRQMLCDADLALLDECQLLLAVLLYNDPGTLIEIGIASARGVPVIVYDPHSLAENLMLTQVPFCVSSDLDEVISAIFSQASAIKHA